MVAMADPAGSTSTLIVVPGGHSMVALLGSSDELLQLIERSFSCDIHVRGNEITLSGDPTEVAVAARLFAELMTLLERGEVIAYPTDTVYGLGCDLMNKHAIDRLYALKGMDRTHQLTFICPDLSDIARYAVVDNPVYRVLRRFLPGPYTFILQATRDVPKLVQMKRKSVGIRVPALEAPRVLAQELGRPIISTTAARPGEEPFVDPHEIHDAFPGLALVLDGGAGGTTPTTVVDLTQSPPVVLRQGAGPVDEFRP